MSGVTPTPQPQFQAIRDTTAPYLTAQYLTVPNPTSTVPNSMEHGTRYGYSLGCPCGPCREANGRYMKEWRRQKREGLRAGVMGGGGGQASIQATGSTERAQRVNEVMARVSAPRPQMCSECGYRTDTMQHKAHT